eukprot:5496479-Prymnesium_polylepis.1
MHMLIHSVCLHITSHNRASAPTRSPERAAQLIGREVVRDGNEKDLAVVGSALGARGETSAEGAGRWGEVSGFKTSAN